MGTEINNVNNNPNYSGNVRTGMGTNIQTQLGTQLTGLSGEESAATSKGQALLGEAGQVAPVMQFGILTNPLTGQPIAQGSTQGGTNGNQPWITGNSTIDTAVNQALAQVKAGGDPTSSDITGTLNSLGALAQNAYKAGVLAINNGSYNPTTASALSQTNASLAGQYKTQAIALDTGLKQLDAVSGLASDFIAKAGVNPTDTPLLNRPINTYIANSKNSVGVKEAALILNDIKKFQGQILANGAAGIPTDVSSAMASMDPGLLSAGELTQYLAALKTLGGNQLSVLQGQTSSLGGGNTYTGTPTGPISALATPTPNTGPLSGATGINTPMKEAAAGVAITAGQDVVNIATNASTLLGYIIAKLK